MKKAAKRPRTQAEDGECGASQQNEAVLALREAKDAEGIYSVAVQESLRFLQTTVAAGTVSDDVLCVVLAEVKRLLTSAARPPSLMDPTRASGLQEAILGLLSACGKEEDDRRNGEAHRGLPEGEHNVRSAWTECVHQLAMQPARAIIAAGVQDSVLARALRLLASDGPQWVPGLGPVLRAVLEQGRDAHAMDEVARMIGAGVNGQLALLLEWEIPAAHLHAISNMNPRAQSVQLVATLESILSHAYTGYTAAIDKTLGEPWENLGVADKLACNLVQLANQTDKGVNQPIQLLYCLTHNRFLPVRVCCQAGIMQAALQSIKVARRHEDETFAAYQLVAELIQTFPGPEGVFTLMACKDSLKIVVGLGDQGAVDGGALDQRTTEQIIHLLDYAMSRGLRGGSCTESAIMVVELLQLGASPLMDQALDKLLRPRAASSPELLLRALLPLTPLASTWVACFVAKHSPLPTWWTMLEACDVVELLCDSLASTGSPGSLPHDSVVSKTLKAEVAGSLSALLGRLGPRKEQGTAAQRPGIGNHFHPWPVLSNAALEGEFCWQCVTIVVEGKHFSTLRAALVQASPVFKAMLEGDLAEGQRNEVIIHDMSMAAWKVVAQFVYTGGAEVPTEAAQQVLAAAEQYQLGGLKKLSEAALAAAVTPANVMDMLDLSDHFHAKLLQRSCIECCLEVWAWVPLQGVREWQRNPSSNHSVEIAGCACAEDEGKLRRRVASGLLPLLRQLMQRAA